VLCGNRIVCASFFGIAAAIYLLIRSIRAKL
jgi:hypothetical protein